MSGGPAAGGTGATGASTRSAQRPQAGTTPAKPPASTTALAGSPSETELVRELAGLAVNKPAAAVPAWSSLLLAPLFRGTTVSLVSRS